MNCENPYILQIAQLILSAIMTTTASAEQETSKKVGLLKYCKESKLKYPWILTKLEVEGCVYINVSYPGPNNLFEV
jgi:hypothetical protein